MKFASVLMAAAVAVSTLAVAHGEIRAGIAYAGEDESYDEAFLPVPPSRFRQLQAGSGGEPTTPPPTPTPTTPEPTTPTPTTPEVTTPTPTTPEVTTPAPSTDTPAPTTPGETPTPTTDTPIESPPTDAPSSGSDQSNSKSDESSGNGSDTDNRSSSSQAGTNTKDSDSGSNTVTIVAIVGGIVVGVALLAFVAVTCARKRRDEDDDPLSPFELSMDKGYNGGAGAQQTYNNNGNNAAYSGARTVTNSAGAAAFGASHANQASSNSVLNNSTNAAATAGVAYNTQFYDVQTSPYHQQQQQPPYKKYSSEEIQANDTSLWMSAMEPKEHEAEGRSVPPEVSIPGDEVDSKMQSFVSAGSRNSYDAVSSEIDIDQSSVLSGGSDLDKEFPDFEDESSRGSYEL